MKRFALILALTLFADSAHAGEAKRLRITVLRPARVHARAAAGFPLRQSGKYLAGGVFYGAKAVSNVTGWMSPGGMLVNVLFH